MWHHCSHDHVMPTFTKMDDASSRASGSASSSSSTAKVSERVENGRDLFFFLFD